MTIQKYSNMTRQKAELKQTYSEKGYFVQSSWKPHPL